MSSAGQGRPPTSRAGMAPALQLRAIFCIAILLHALAAGSLPSALHAADRPSGPSVDARPSEPTLTLRISWGGGIERRWRGTIQVTAGALANPRPLGIEADEPGSMWASDGKVVVESRSARAYDGVDVDVHAPLDAKLLLALSSVDAPPRAEPIEVPLATLVAGTHTSPLDDRQNRLLVRRAPGDVLRVSFPSDRKSLVCDPGEMLRLEVHPHLLGVEEGSRVRFEMQLAAARGGVVWSEDREVSISSKAPTPLPLEIKLPETEGVYNLGIAARIKPRLRWQPQTVAERKVQLVVVEPQRLPAPLADGRTLDKVADIDPLEPMNPNWWNRFASLPIIPGWRKGPLGTGDAHAWQHPISGESMIELRPGRDGAISWEAYPLPIEKPGEPHVLEVEYPSDVPQSLGISIVEPNAAGTVLPIGLDSGVYVSDEAVGSPPRWERHRVVFWPRTRSPLVLVTNRKPGSPAVYGRLRVYGGQPRLSRAFAREHKSQRLLAAYFNRPLFPENFSANEALDPASSHSLDDWTTFHEASTRLVEYLNHVGYNGLTLAVLADGSSIYPSQILEPTPRYDTGTFFGSGQDPLRKDVLELLLRMCDREGLQLVPELHFDMPLADLEALRRPDVAGAGSIASAPSSGPMTPPPEGATTNLAATASSAAGLEWVDSQGVSWLARNRPWRGTAPYYNTLNPRVQEAMLRVVRELLSRYSGHPSLAGLSIELSPLGYAQLLGPEWGFDDVTIDLFERDHPGVRVPGLGPTRFAARARYLLTDQRSEWIAWRARKLEEFYARMQDEVTRLRPGARLYLSGADMLKGRETERDLRPTLPRRGQVVQAMLNVGIDAELGRRLTDTVLLRPQRLAPARPLEAEAVDLEINQSAEWDRAVRGSPLPASLFFHEPQEARLESFDAKGPFKNGFTRLVTQASPSADVNRRRFAHALATLDAHALVDGGWLLPLGQEAALADFVGIYRRLPAAKFETLSGSTQPVTVRMLSDDDRTWLYLVNDSPWPVALALRAALPVGCRIEPIDPSQTAPQPERGPQGADLRFQLAPYGVAGVWFSAPKVALSHPRVELDTSVEAELAARIADLEARCTSLQRPPPIAEVPENAGFELPPTSDEPIPGWAATVPTRGQVELDTSQKHNGQAAVRMTNRELGKAASLRSAPITPPVTGRLWVLAWLRVDNPASQPPLRMAIEYQHEGQPRYRHGCVGLPESGQAPVPLSSKWDWKVFRVMDLPTTGVTDLRVRFDLMGPGEVWIDDVQLFDLAFEAEGEWIDLAKQVYKARQALQAGQVSDCMRILDDYWPRFLMTHVPLAAAPPPRTAAQPPRPTEPQPKPGFLDKLKQTLRF